MDPDRQRPAGRALTEAAVQNVRLAYRYLDEGDLDGYASLLDADARLDRPGFPGRWGRDAVAWSLLPTVGGRHELDQVLTRGRRIAVTGWWIELSGAAPGVPFADVFDVSDDCLLLTCRRFPALPPDALL